MGLPQYGRPIVRVDVSLAALDGVVIAAPIAGDILIYDGTNWRNRAVTGDITISATGVVAIAAGVIVDADISATAEIAVSKLADGAARQILQTDAAGTGVEWTSAMDGVTIGGTTPAPGTFNTLTKTGTTGINWSNVSDEDYEIFILSGVTGAPRWGWDEAGDRWTSNFGIIITVGSLNLNDQGSILNIGAAGNDFGAAQLDLVANYIILGANGLNINTTAGAVGFNPATSFNIVTASAFFFDSSTSSTQVHWTEASDSADRILFRLRKARGSLAVPAAIESGDNIGTIIGAGYDSSGYDDDAFIQFQATENHADGAHGTKIEWFTTANGSAAIGRRMTLDHDGGLFMEGATGGSQGLGTANFTAAYDDGVILTTDYIFDLYFDKKVLARDKKYEQTWLPSVVETYAFVQEHRHLPWIVGREEWEGKGRLSLGQVQQRLWEGQEQQQLHIFEHEFRLTTVEDRVTVVEEANEVLRNQLVTAGIIPEA